MRNCQTGNDGAQQFALARTSSADDKAMWSHAALGSLFDVQKHRLAGCANAKRNTQQIFSAAGEPGIHSRQAVGRSVAKQGEQANLLRKVLLFPFLANNEWRQTARDTLADAHIRSIR